MQLKLSPQIAIGVAGFVLGVFACGWLAPRASQAQTVSGWGSVLTGQTQVRIQFNDSQPPTQSAWYPGTVKGYDGNMVAFANQGVDETIYMPISSIRQLAVVVTK